MSTGTTESDRARRIHHDALVIDLHADTPTECFLDEGYDFGARHPSSHVDLPRLRDGGVDAQFLIAWVPEAAAARPGASFEHARRLVRAIHDVVRRTPGARIAIDSAGILAAREAGEVAVLIGVEGGHAIENSLDKLRWLHRHGARYLTLTWNNSNDWADAAGAPPRHGGLTDFGREVVRELDRLRVLVDVSHVAESTFDDVLETTRHPVLASHSCARALADHPRNLTDDQLRDLARNGGVVGVNFFPAFLDEEVGRAYDWIDAETARREAALRNEGLDPAEARARARRWHDERVRELPPVPIERVAEHIEHIAAVAGIEHVALGSDFDGIPNTPVGLPDIAALPALTELLLRRGFSDDEARKVLGANVLRVLTAVLG